MTEELKNALLQKVGLNEKEAIELVDFVSHHTQISAANLQLKFIWGYNKAGRAIDQLEKHGLVSAFDGSKPRTVLIPKKY